MFRNLIRYVGLMLILTVFIASGLQAISSPAVTAVSLSKTRLPALLAKANVRLTPQEYAYVTQGVGAAYVSFALFILLGVGRGFFAFLLALLTGALTFLLHVHPKNVFSTSEQELVHVLKNISIIGALLFVMGSGQRNLQFVQARADNAKSNKKQN